MRRTILVSFLLSFLTVNVYALKVDVDEIKKAKRVEFENYTGKHKKSESVKEIRAIGKTLARKGINQKIRFHMKYSLIHAVSKKEPEKLSADIFSIDKNARVDHVNNIQRIISGYLENMYGYSPKNARTLSLFITYYNAVYRGNIDYFSSTYKSVVIKHINKNNAGLSTKYYEWPGATKIIIPLTEDAMKGKLDSIDPDIISDKETKKEISRDEKNLDERKDLVDIKKKIIDRDKKEISKKKDELKKDEKKIEKDKQIIDKEKKELEDKKKEIQKKEDAIKKEKEKSKTIKDPVEKKKKENEIAKEEKKLEKEKDTTKKEEKEVKKKEEKIADKNEEIKKESKDVADKEKEIAKKEEKLEEEKKEIKKDEIKEEIEKDPVKAKEKLKEKEKELAKKEDELDKREDELRDKVVDKNIYAKKLYYLKIRDYLEGGHYNNEMYMINASTRKIEFKSPVQNICGSRYDVFSGGVAIITHTGEHKAGHHLTLVDRETLQAKITGEDNIFWRSFIEIREGFIYAIMYDNGKFYLGKFDSNLKKVAQSKEELSENTFISFFEDYIYINRWDKKIIVLKVEDLSLIDEIKP